MTHLALAPRFNLDNPTEQEKEKLAEIWAYASSMAKSDNIPDIIWEVVHLEGVLGAPRLGESRLDKVYRWAKLTRQEAEIQRQKQNVANSSQL